MRPRKRERDVAEMAAESGRRPAHVFRAFDIRAGGGGDGVAKRAIGHARLDGPGDDKTVRTRELGELVRHVHLPGDRLIGMPRKRGEHSGGGKRDGEVESGASVGRVDLVGQGNPLVRGCATDLAQA